MKDIISKERERVGGERGTRLKDSWRGEDSELSMVRHSIVASSKLRDMYRVIEKRGN